MATLTVEKGKQQGLRLEVVDDSLPTVVGRDPSADVFLDDERASRHHARLSRRRGEWVVEDLGSRNGIFVQGQNVRRAVLAGGDLIRIGSTVLRFQPEDRIDPLAGREAQGSRLLELLHEEGGVLTYRAHQLAMDRLVRIDILHPRRPLAPPAAKRDRSAPDAGDAVLSRVKLAAKTASDLQHPRLVPIVRSEIPSEDGGGSIVLRWTDSPTLASRWEGLRALPLADRLRTFRQLAEAVLARSRAVLSDPKGLSYPLGLRHIFLDATDGVLVTALELPALVALLKGQAPDLPGFAPYLAPEWIEGREPSWAGAVYNLGALGYHLLTLTAPMGEGSAEEVLANHQSLAAAPPRLACPELPAAVGDLLERMLEKDPARRPASAEAILAALPPLEPSGRSETPPPRPAAAGSLLGPGPRATASPAAPPGAPPPAARRVAAVDRPAAEPAPRRLPVAIHLLFWPALWAGLFWAGRTLMHAILR